MGGSNRGGSGRSVPNDTVHERRRGTAPADRERTARAVRAPLVRTGNAARAPEVTEEDLPRVVWQLAWPAVLTMLLQLTNGLVDMFSVGRLGPAAQAAVR
jgi:hypothetical protein